MWGIWPKSVKLLTKLWDAAWHGGGGCQKGWALQIWGGWNGSGCIHWPESFPIPSLNFDKRSERWSSAHKMNDAWPVATMCIPLLSFLQEWWKLWNQLKCCNISMYTTWYGHGISWSTAFDIFDRAHSSHAILQYVIMNVACNECESGSPCLNVRHPNDLGACLAASAHCNQSFVLLRDDDRHQEFLMDLQESSGTFGISSQSPYVL